MFIDSHCHLNMLVPTIDHSALKNVLNEAKKQGVDYFLSVAVILADHEGLTQIAAEFDNVFISAGLHPNESPGETVDEAILLSQCRHPRVVAVGETGLDHYRSQGDLSWQTERFIKHIHCAKACQKPLIIHMREATEQTLALMRQEGAEKVGGVMHCFTENWQTAKKALDLGFYISLSGIVTFKNAEVVQEVARQVPLDRLLIETDCPYLAPVPHRGKPNVPAFVRHVGEYIADLRQIPVEVIGEKTSENFFRLFRHAVKK